jgi:DNA-binding beta-propeller fold protein YncE
MRCDLSRSAVSAFAAAAVSLAGCGGGGSTGAGGGPVPVPMPSPTHAAVDVSEVGRYAFVPEFNRGAVAVYDLRSGSVTTEIAIAGAPTAVAVSRFQPYLFAVDFARTSIWKVDLRDVSQGAILGPGGVNVWDAKYAPDGAHVYFTESQGVGYDVVDPVTMSKRRVNLDNQKAGEIAPSPRAIAFDTIAPNAMYLTDIDEEFMQIDTSRDVIASYAFTPYAQQYQTEVRALPGGGAIFGCRVALCRYVNGALQPAINIPGGNSYVVALAVAPDGNTAYAANIGSSAITAVDLKTGATTGTVAVNDPQGIDVTPDGSRLLVLDATDATIVEVDRASLSIVRTTQLPTGAHPRAYGGFVR